MQKLLIKGKKELSGLIKISGSKNATLPILAASILAKVYRDDLMIKLSNDYPQYGWPKNKGYGTKEHFSAIHQFGVSEYHRRSFLKNLNL